MLKTVVALLLTMSFLIGGAVTLAYAAQDDLPGEPLYALKLAEEDFRLALTTDELAEMELLQTLIQNRVDEMLALEENGEDAPEPLVNRLNYHLENALRLAAGMNDEDMQQAMLMIRTRTEAQIRELNRINLTGNGTMLQIHQRLQEQMRLAELGLEDPLEFRQQTQQQTQNQPDEPGSTGTPRGPEANGEQPGPQGPQGSPEPQGPQGPQNTGTPQNTSAPQGPNGPQGPQGTPEPAGPQGPSSPDSDSSQQGGNGQGGPPPTPTPTPTPVSGNPQGNPPGPGNGNNGNH